METRSRDTSPEMDEMQIELLRQAGPGRRLDMAVQLSQLTWNLARGAVDRAFPKETEDQRDLRFLSNIYGVDLAQKFIAFRKEKFGPRDGTLA